MERLKQQLNKTSWGVWGVFIAVLAMTLSIFSMQDLAPTVDERAHIPAGYSYVVEGDYRLNPEHPPLLKYLSGVSVWTWSQVSGQEIVFDTSIPAWTEQVNGQWDMGTDLLFRDDNPRDGLIFWSRIPTVILFGVLILYVGYATYFYSKSRRISVLAMLFTGLSPNIIAHARFVTTDVIATLAFVLLADWFVRYLQHRTWKQAVGLTAAVFFGALAKFSIVMLAPLFIVIWGVHTWVVYRSEIPKRLLQAVLHATAGILAIVVGISLVYWGLMYAMPVEEQREIITTVFFDSPYKAPTEHALLWIVDQPVLRYFGHYLTGLAMVIQRVGGGNTTFFLGEFTRQSFFWYFPATYLFKEPLSFLILLAASFGFGSVYLAKNRLRRVRQVPLFWCVVAGMVVWYWVVSLTGNLNLGIRHILPVLPLTYMLVSAVVFRVLVPAGFSKLIFGGLLGWYILAPILSYPFYVAHLNALVGGNQYGYQIFTDSNIDWGQDLIRLNQWTEEQGIDRIYVDYFGAADPREYLGDKAIPYWSEQGPKQGEWAAISVTKLQDSFFAKEQGQIYQEYWWLRWREPDASIGGSILLYKVERY